MPARFVEVANFAGAARTSEALSYLPWLLPNGTALFLSPGSLWRLGSNNSSGLLRRSAAAAARVDCPAAKLLLLLAVALLAARCALVHVQARRALAQFGHSRCS